MTVTAMLTVAPLDSAEVAFDAETAKAIDALEDFDVRYETHPIYDYTTLRDSADEWRETLAKRIAEK